MAANSHTCRHFFCFSDQTLDKRMGDLIGGVSIIGNRWKRKEISWG